MRVILAVRKCQEGMVQDLLLRYSDKNSLHNTHCTQSQALIETHESLANWQDMQLDRHASLLDRSILSGTAHSVAL